MTADKLSRNYGPLEGAFAEEIARDIEFSLCNLIFCESDVHSIRIEYELSAFVFRWELLGNNPAGIREQDRIKYKYRNKWPNALDVFIRDDLEPYFSYGSNMHYSRLKNRLGLIRIYGRCETAGWRFVCTKPGQDNSAKANIIPDYHDSVWGVTYLITPEQAEILDKFEGDEYIRKPIKVLSRCNSTQLEEIDSFAYIYEGPNTTVRPDEYYREHIIQGAKENKLPEDYINKINLTMN